jgi:hypothetical protein
VLVYGCEFIRLVFQCWVYGPVVDVDALWKVRQRDDVDVGGIGPRRLYRRGFNETREALAITVDGGIDPVRVSAPFVFHGSKVPAQVLRQ